MRCSSQSTRWTHQAFAGLAFAAAGAVWFAVGPFSMPVVNEFGWSHWQVFGGFALCLAVLGLLSPLMGTVLERRAHLSLVVPGILVIAVSFFLFGLTQALIWWLLINLLLGASLSPVLISAMSKTGFGAAGFGLGGMIAAVMATELISPHGWRATYHFLAIFLLFIAILATLTAVIGSVQASRTRSQLRPHVPDVSRYQWLGLGLLALALALISAPLGWRAGNPFLVIFPLFIAILATLTAVIGSVQASRTRSQLRPHVPDVSRYQWLGLGLLALALALISAPQGAAIVLSFSYLIGVGFSSTTAGLASGFTALAAVIASLVSARLSRSAPHHFILAAVSLLQGIVIVGLMNADNMFSMFLTALLFGLTIGTMYSAAPAVAGKFVGYQRITTACKWLVMAMSLGAIPGILLAASVFDSTGSYKQFFNYFPLPLSFVGGTLMALLAFPLSAAKAAVSEVQATEPLVSLRLCRKCNRKLPSAAMFCPKCGSPTEESL